MEEDKIARSEMYPDPSAQTTGANAFPYANQQQQQQQQQTHPGGPQTPQAPPAPMHGGNSDANDMQNNMQHFYSQQHIAQQGLNVNQSNGQDSLDSESKKKQKVSRACDECRRKKIKCDAESEDPGVRCSACARSESTCQFSRLPQKRGPSKGYIKELAERVHRLEGTSGVSPFQPSPHGLPQDFNGYSPSPEFMASEARKRTHSIAEGSQAFGNGADQLQSYAKGFTPNMSSTNAPIPFHGIPDPSQNMIDLQGLGGEPVDEYYREMHTYFPILPDSRGQLQSWLSRVRKPVKDALLATVAVAMQTSAIIVDPRTLEIPAAMLSKLQIEQAKGRTTHDNVMFLQALLFMIIAQETSGPGKNEAILWYGVAFGIAKFLKLHLNEEMNPEDSPEVAESKINGRRAYLVLVMLDRWHAASMSEPFNVPDDNVWLLPSDHNLLRDSAYNLIRLSLSLGHVSETLLHRRAHLTKSPPDLLLVRTLKGELERFREGAEQSFPTLRHVHLAYLHAKLLSDRHLELNVSNTKAIMTGAFTIASLLATDQNRASPLTHHFAALATITLAEVIERDEQHIGDALKRLQNDLDNGHIQYRFGVAHNRPAWSTAISTFISKKSGAASNRGGLQHLADAAVGADGGHAGEDVGKKLEGQPIDWTAMTLEGYLRLFE